jgi:hypothetical protein
MIILTPARNALSYAVDRHVCTACASARRALARSSSAPSPTSTPSGCSGARRHWILVHTNEEIEE